MLKPFVNNKFAKENIIIPHPYFYTALLKLHSPSFLIQEFFLMVKHILRTTPSHGVASFQKWTPAEVAFNEQLIKFFMA